MVNPHTHKGDINQSSTNSGSSTTQVSPLTIEPHEAVHTALWRTATSVLVGPQTVPACAKQLVTIGGPYTSICAYPRDGEGNSRNSQGGRHSRNVGNRQVRTHSVLPPRRSSLQVIII